MSLFRRMRRQHDDMPYRVMTTIDLGHGSAAVRAHCEECDGYWREIIPFFAVISTCPICGAQKNTMIIPRASLDGLYSDGPHLTGNGPDIILEVK